MQTLPRSYNVNISSFNFVVIEVMPRYINGINKTYCLVFDAII